MATTTKMTAAVVVFVLMAACGGDKSSSESAVGKDAPNETTEEIASDTVRAICAAALGQESTRDARQVLREEVASATDTGLTQQQLTDAVEAQCGSDIVALGAPPVPDAPAVVAEEPEEYTEAEQRLFLATAINSEARSLLIEVAEDVRNVDSVDVLTYEDDTIRIAVSSGFRGEQYHEEAAWGLTRELGALFWSGEIEWLQSLETSLQVEVNDGTWRCDHQAMEAVGGTRLSRAEWAAACRA